MLRLVASVVAVIALWQLVVTLTGVPHFLFPAPGRVMDALWQHHDLLVHHAGFTLAATLSGLVFGCLAGTGFGLLLYLLPGFRSWAWPWLLASQAIPTFALAPLMVLWAGYGLLSKVLVTALMIFFPVMAAFYDGLRRVDPAWLHLAQTMRGKGWPVLLRVKIPAALPQLATGLRLAAIFAPVGAVAGEWVGSSGGLGYLMLQANGRMQTDLLFAALGVLVVMALVVHKAMDMLLQRLVPYKVGKQ